jgi:two-component system nitrate/nitrite response regulator NarL
MAQAVATILVDRDNLFREGLRRILSTTAFRVTKVLAAMEDIPLHSLRSSRPTLFLIAMDDGYAATTAAVGRLKAESPTARIVILSDRCELDDALAVLRAGANGYLLKQLSCDALIKALDLVMLGVTVLPTTLNRALPTAINDMLGEPNEKLYDDGPAATAPAPLRNFEHTPRRLSDRETEVLRCLMNGEANKTIARKFDVTEATVKVHIKAILRTISVRNRTQAAVWAHRHLLYPGTAEQGSDGAQQPLLMSGHMHDGAGLLTSSR